MIEAYDAKWFDRIKRINAQVPYRLRAASYAEARRNFLANTAVEPDLEYQDIVDEAYEEKLTALKSLADDIVACGETHAAVKDLYLRKVAEKDAQLRLIRSAYDAQHDRSEAHGQVFKRCTELVYGKPQKEVFDDLVGRIQRKLANAPASVRGLGSYVRTMDLFSMGVISHVPVFEPISPSIPVEGDVIVDAELVKSAFERALDEAGLYQWTVSIDSAKVGSMVVWPRTRRVSVPNSGVLRARHGEKRLTERRLSALIAHEIRTHAVRAENGSASPLKLLSIGLDGYWRGEEGLATYREQMIAGAEDYSAPNVYLAIGLAYGLDRGERARTFSEVFAIMRDYFAVEYADTDADIDRLAFLTCIHVFRGATRQSPGLVLTKEITYREGNIAIHQLMKEVAADTSWLDAGKFDPANQVHMYALRTLGIIPGA